MAINNCKLKILYKCHMAAYAAHTTNKSTHFLTAQKTKTRATQKSLPGGLGKKRSGEWAKSRTEKDRKSKRTRQKYKRAEIEKIELTALRSRQGGDIGNPRPPFGGPTLQFTCSFNHHTQEKSLSWQFWNTSHNLYLQQTSTIAKWNWIIQVLLENT